MMLQGEDGMLWCLINKSYYFLLVKSSLEGFLNGFIDWSHLKSQTRR